MSSSIATTATSSPSSPSSSTSCTGSITTSLKAISPTLPPLRHEPRHHSHSSAAQPPPPAQHHDQSQTHSPELITPEPIPHIPPPWRVSGDVYCTSFWSSAAAARRVPASTAYSPLEALAADFVRPAGSRPAGGLGMIQILRYRNSPVGPYDEMLIVPGSFDWARRRPDGQPLAGRNPRITRIYVSQKQTCYNGRLNWSCPKHLARFEWTSGPNDSVGVKVFPHDTGGDANEATPSDVPFFQASFTPVAYAPAFPFATHWLDFLGFNTTVVNPPLPPGRGFHGELPGTDYWCSFVPCQYSRSTRLGWFDMAQPASSDGAMAALGEPDNDDKRNQAEGAGRYNNFWPGLGRWQLGIKMENAEVIFDHPLEVWPAASRSGPNL